MTSGKIEEEESLPPPTNERANHHSTTDQNKDEIERKEEMGIIADTTTTNNTMASLSSETTDEDLKARKRKERLEQNRISARESRKRKKTMIEELQRTVITLSRENKDLNQRNESLRRQLVEIGTKFPNAVPLHALMGPNMAFDNQQTQAQAQNQAATTNSSPSSSTATSSSATNTPTNNSVSNPVGTNNNAENTIGNQNAMISNAARLGAAHSMGLAAAAGGQSHYIASTGTNVSTGNQGSAATAPWTMQHAAATTTAASTK